MGIMTKVRDGLNGRINLDGTISKHISNEERHKLDRGANLAEKNIEKSRGKTCINLHSAHRSSASWGYSPHRTGGQH